MSTINSKMGVVLSHNRDKKETMKKIMIEETKEEYNRVPKYIKNQIGKFTRIVTNFKTKRPYPFPSSQARQEFENSNSNSNINIIDNLDNQKATPGMLSPRNDISMCGTN